MGGLLGRCGTPVSRRRYSTGDEVSVAVIEAHASQSRHHTLPQRYFMIRLGLLLAVIVLAVVFAAQNADVVNLSFLGWNLDASLAIIIVLCFSAGALVAALALMPGMYRARSEQRKTKQRLSELEHDSQQRQNPSASPSAPSSASIPSTDSNSRSSTTSTS